MELSVLSSSVNATSTELCNQDVRSTLIFGCWFICKYTLILPLCVNILHVGFQHWRSQSFKKNTNIDFFTYNLSIMEMISCLGGIIFLSGVFANDHITSKVGYNIFSVILPAEMFTHSFVCVDVYLALVHPVFYLKSRQTSVRICKVSIVAIWALTCSFTPIVHYIFPAGIQSYLSVTHLGINIAVVFFCTISISRVLLQPRRNGKVDKAKRKAFYISFAILVISLIWFTGFMVILLLIENNSWDLKTVCVILVSGFWFSFASSLVLPVMFLHRHKKIICCCNCVE